MSNSLTNRFKFIILPRRSDYRACPDCEGTEVREVLVSRGDWYTPEAWGEVRCDHDRMWRLPWPRTRRLTARRAWPVATPAKTAPTHQTGWDADAIPF